MAPLNLKDTLQLKGPKYFKLVLRNFIKSENE